MLPSPRNRPYQRDYQRSFDKHDDYHVQYKQPRVRDTHVGTPASFRMQVLLLFEHQKSTARCDLDLEMSAFLRSYPKA